MAKKIIFIILTITLVCSFGACSSVSENMRDTTEEEIIITNENEDVIESISADEGTNGGTKVCLIHSSDYHCFSSYLTDYVGDDVFMNWFKSTDASDKNTDGGCLYPEQNIYEFIRYFDFPKEVLIELYNEYLLPNYNIDLLYNGTADENDQYYRSISDAQRVEDIKFSNLNEIKIRILLQNLDVFNSNTNINSYSLIEMMQMTKTPVDTVQNVITNSSKANDINIFSSQFDYDFSMFEAKDEENLYKLVNEHSPFYLDCIICGLTPYETRYEKQVAENKEISVKSDKALS